MWMHAGPAASTVVPVSANHNTKSQFRVVKVKVTEERPNKIAKAPTRRRSPIGLRPADKS